MKQLEEKELSKSDFIIAPNLGGWSATDFSKADSLVSLGYNSTLPVLKKIKYSIRVENYVTVVITN